MKIALLGYGKMGKTIERIATERGHEITHKISGNIESEDLTGTDVAIDFSAPSAALKNITTCFSNNLPVVSGTTGWLEDYPKAVQSCKENAAAFIYASNFSLGVNIFFELNRKLAGLMKSFPEYQVSIEEIHHTQKLDAPSGTAITLAGDIISSTDKTNWTMGAPKAEDLPISAKRVKNVPGTHKVTYSSPIDTINIEHIAHSRDGFALGAIIAAEWLLNRKGIFTMKDVLF